MKEQISRRPVVVFAAGYAVGVAAAVGTGWAALLLLPVILLRQLSILFVAIVGLGLGVMFAPHPVAKPDLGARYYTGVIDVVSFPRDTATGYYFVARAGQERWMATTRTRPDISLGDRLNVMGRVEPLSEFSERYWLDQSVTAQVKISVPPVIIHHGSFWARIALRIRESFLRFSEATLTKRDAQLLDGLCMNHQAELDTDMQEKLQMCGLLHLFSASGANLLLVGAILATLHRVIPVPRSWFVFGMMSGLLLYVAAAGMTSSALRAWGMILLASTSYLVRREFDMLSALGITLVANGLLAPATLLQPGTHFSYAALLGFAIFVDFDRLQAAEGNWLLIAWEGLRTNLVAWIFSTPILAYHANFLSLAGAISTFFASIPATMASILGFVIWPISWILPGVAKSLCSILVSPLLAILHFLVDKFGDSLFFVPVQPFSAWWLVVIYGCAFALWQPRLRRP